MHNNRFYDSRSKWLIAQFCFNIRRSVEANTICLPIFYVAQVTAPGERVEEKLSEEVHQGGEGVDLVDRIHHDGLGGGVNPPPASPAHPAPPAPLAPPSAPGHLVVLLAPVHRAED